MLAVALGWWLACATGVMGAGAVEDEPWSLRRVIIVTPGFFNPNLTLSLSRLAPAIDTGIERLNALYPRFNWSSVYLQDPSFIDGTPVQDNLAFWLSRWYYTEIQETDIPVVVGEKEYCLSDSTVLSFHFGSVNMYFYPVDTRDKTINHFREAVAKVITRQLLQYSH